LGKLPPWIRKWPLAFKEDKLICPKGLGTHLFQEANNPILEESFKCEFLAVRETSIQGGLITLVDNSLLGEQRLWGLIGGPFHSQFPKGAIHKAHPIVFNFPRAELCKGPN